MAAASELIRDALEELGVQAAGEAMSADLQDLGLRRLNRILRSLASLPEASYRYQTVTATTTPGVASYTVGPGGNVVTTARPDRIEAVRLSVSGIWQPVALRDRTWWRTISTPSVQGLPTDAWYDRAYPTGTLSFWPVPNAAYSIEVTVPLSFPEKAASDPMGLPPILEEYVFVRLVMSLAAPLGLPVPPSIVEAHARVTQLLRDARERADRVTADAPTWSGAGWDWQTGA